MKSAIKSNIKNNYKTRLIKENVGVVHNIY